jgi:hypothetical protein
MSSSSEFLSRPPRIRRETRRSNDLWLWNRCHRRSARKSKARYKHLLLTPKGSVGGWRVMISRRRQRSSTADRLAAAAGRPVIQVCHRLARAHGAPVWRRRAGAPRYGESAALPFARTRPSGTLGDREEVFTCLSSGQPCITRGYRNHSFTSQIFANNAVAVSAVLRLRPTAYSSRQSESRVHSWPGRFDIEIDYVAAV